MNNLPNISLYCDQMKLVKKRIEVVLFFEQKKRSALYTPSTIESVYLQYRKILELIAMASLVANKEVYSSEYSNFARHWNARRMFESLETLNSDFYPIPIVDKGIKLINKQEGYLTKEEYFTLYNDCGAIMHTQNPYGTKINYDVYFSKMVTWRKLIIGLLNNHKIRLLNDPNMYVIHMKEKRDNKVHGYTFVPREKLGTATN